jgi:hypothetical protein
MGGRKDTNQGQVKRGISNSYQKTKHSANQEIVTAMSKPI